MDGGPPQTRVLEARPRELAFHAFRLTVVAGPDTGKVCAASGQELSIGSDPACDLVLTDPAVSRHHCAIKVTSGGFLLRDLGSTNGTTVAGVRVESAYVEPAMSIAAGESRLRFELGEGEVREPLSEEERSGWMLGRSPAMRRIFALLPRIAGSESTVLIEGETGTGKGLLAEAIHQQSPRAAGPFLVIDCGAIPPTLIESELFGHERGAFTGAHAPHPGAFEAAAGGTIFLDEIGELPLDMQPKLLRALEDRSVRRVGSTRSIALDVRIVAASNRDLRSEVNRGHFRADLFYRLNTIRLRIPPLRDRREDIPLLIEHFYRQLATAAEIEPPADLLATALRQEWPGNVRELRSAVERVVLLGQLDVSADAPAARGPDPAPVLEEVFDAAASFRSAKERAVARWERWWIDELLRRHGGNLSRAARAARMDRNHLRELALKHGVHIHS